MSEIDLEWDFIEELVDEVLWECKCTIPGCNSKRLMKKGTITNYLIEYESTGKKETNIYIIMDIDPIEAQANGIQPVVFNGLCKTNMDFATALRMVIK